MNIKNIYYLHNNIMEIQITCQNVNLSEKRTAYLHDKIDKAIRAGGRLDLDATSITAEVRPAKVKGEDNVSVEITIFTKKAMIRAEEKAMAFETAVDLAETKLQKQLRRYKERYKARHRGEHWITDAELIEDIPTQKSNITKRQRFSNDKPIHEEEAVELMELAGHDFFLFNNVNTGRWSVAYKRHNGEYGIVEPKIGDEE